MGITERGVKIENPFEQSFFLLVHLSYLQAFTDVNKRTARLAANLPLIKKNLVPQSFKDVLVKDYMSAMIAMYELQDLQPMIDLYVYTYMRTCAAYDSTVKSLGFDEVRVRYRQKRRGVVRKIILQMLVGDKMVDYIKNEADEAIPEHDRKEFIEDVIEDLDQIDESRIVGLGVTPEQLEDWAKRFFNKKDG